MTAGTSNDLDNLVDISQGYQLAFYHVLSATSFREQELSSSSNYFHTVTYVLFQHLLEIQRSRLTIYQGQQDDRNGLLKIGVFVEKVQYNIRILISFNIDDNSDRFFEIGLVPDSRNTFDPTVIDQTSDFFNDAVAVLMERNLRNNDARTTSIKFGYTGLSSNDDRSPPG